MPILLNRKYHCRKALILLRFHLVHNVDCIHTNVKIIKSPHSVREKDIVQLHLYAFLWLRTGTENCAQMRFRDPAIRGTLE